MIYLYEKNSIDLNVEGEILDDICISSKTNWNRNGTWIIEQEYIKDNDKSNLLENGKIVKVLTEKGYQPFKIYKINKKSFKYIIVTGYHIGFDFNNYFIKSLNVENKTGRLAIEDFKTATTEINPFTLSSDINTSSSFKIKNLNGLNALFGIYDDKDTFFSKYGGELVLDNFNISINHTIGLDRGVEILYGKNVKDVEGYIDETNVIVGIVATTKDGIELPDIYYSNLKNNYTNPRTVEIEFDINSEDYSSTEECYTALRNECKKIFDEQNIDKLECFLRIDFINLENTDQFKSDELNERVYQGDILTANLEDYGVNLKLKMISNTYDNLKNCYIDIDLGETQTNIFKDIVNIKDTVDNIVIQNNDTWKDFLDKANEEAAALIQQGIKGGYVVTTPNEILIMDNVDIMSAQVVTRINKNGFATSVTGYNGPYTTSITIDGKINASCITTGVLNAALIKTGILSSLNKKTWINLEEGTFNFADKVTFDGDSFKITLDSGKTVEAEIEANRTELNYRMDTIQGQVDNILDNVGGAIADGIIDEAEANMISNSISMFKKEKESTKLEYAKLINSGCLTEEDKNSLTECWNKYEESAVNLINSITTMIEDGKATEEEKVEYQKQIELYNIAFSDMREALMNFQILSNGHYTDTQFSILDGKISTKIDAGYAQSIATQTVNGFKTEVESNYLKKSDGSLFASKSEITQLADEIKTKVDSEYVSSSITQNNSSIKSEIMTEAGNNYATKDQINNLNISNLVGAEEFKEECVNDASSSISVEISAIRNQVDGKIETHNMSTDPSLNWTTQEDKNKHIGDLWYNPTSYMSHRWNGSSWDRLLDVDGLTAKELAQKKATIYTSKPSSYNANDLWILEADKVWSDASKGEVLVAKTTSSQYDSTHWEKQILYANEDYVVQKFSTVQQDLDSFKVTVGSTYATESSVNSLYSQVAVNASNIKLKVAANEVVSAINMTPENIKISASKIDLEGALTITDIGANEGCEIVAYRGNFNVTCNAFQAGSPSNWFISGESSGVYINTELTVYGSIDVKGDIIPLSTNSLGGYKNYFNNGYISTLNCNDINFTSILRGNYVTADKDLTVYGGSTISGNTWIKGNLDLYTSSSGNFNCRYCGVVGDLAVTGTKNSSQETENYGYRKINAYETAEYYFGDIGEATTENGECYIYLDDMFKECINTDIPYQVFLSKYGAGDIWVEERTPEYFLVKTENDISFGWEIKGRRKGYEDIRLEEDLEMKEFVEGEASRIEAIKLAEQEESGGNDEL